MTYGISTVGVAMRPVLKNKPTLESVDFKAECERHRISGSWAPDKI